MQKVILILCSIILCASQTGASESCFLIQENAALIKSEGNCNLCYSPCSTFKIALALMGYDAGILKDETHPEWPFKEGYAAMLSFRSLGKNPRIQQHG